MRVILVLCLSAPLWTSGLFAAEPYPQRLTSAAAQTYEAEVLRVIDGDTVLVWIPLWPDLSITPRIRLAGVDTPEAAGKCAEEKTLAQKAKALTAEKVPPGSVVKLTSLRLDKYGGRYIAEIWTSDGKNLSDILIDANLARPYRGGKRGGWCGEQ